MIELVFAYFESMFSLAKTGEVLGIAFFMLCYCWFIGWATVIYYERVRRWPSVIGKLAQLAVRQLGATEMILSEQQYIDDSRYHYVVDDVEYIGTRIAPWQISASHNLRGIIQSQVSAVPVQQDGKVRVYYSPKYPNKSYLVRPGWLSLLIAHLIYILPTWWYVAQFHS